MTPLKSVRSENLEAEWRLLKEQDFPECVKSEKRLDHFWRYVFNLKNFNNECKYPLINKLVQAALCLSHGNADVERGFSRSGYIITPTTACTSLLTLNSKMISAQELKYFNNRPSEVPITKEFLNLAATANSKYKNKLDEEKKMLEEQSKKDENEKKKREKELKLIRNKQLQKEKK